MTQEPLRSRFFAWRPGVDTAVALATAALMVPVYYLGTHGGGGLVSTLVFFLFGNGILNVLFPVFYMLFIRKTGVSELGITGRKLWLALAISAGYSLLTWKGLQNELPKHPNVDLLPHLIFNGVILWEPFFVFGWLQLRYERAFGIVPGILLAAGCFAAYHLGTYPLDKIAMLAGVGVLYGGLFRITKNLLTLWPFTWAVASSIGTLQGDMQFDWGQVGMYAGLLAVQLAAIAAMVVWQRRKGVI